jgi:hypothetical protein
VLTHSQHSDIFACCTSRSVGDCSNRDKQAVAA